MPPAELHVDAGLGGQADDAAEHGALMRHAGAGPVQIDHVDPAGAGLYVARGQRDGVAVAVLAPEVTLGQAHRCAAAKVDGGQQVHQAAARAAADEVAQQRQSVAPDFSGWNCAPHSAPRVASAATSPP